MEPPPPPPSSPPPSSPPPQGSPPGTSPQDAVPPGAGPPPGGYPGYPPPAPWNQPQPGYPQPGHPGYPAGEYGGGGYGATGYPPGYPPPGRPAGQGGGNGKLIAIIAGAVAGVLVLCGGIGLAAVLVLRGSGDDPPVGPPPPADSWGTGSIEWLVQDQGGTALDSLWSELGDEFTATGAGEVTLETAPRETYPVQLSTRLHAGDPPDLFASPGGNRLRTMVADGLVRDLTDELPDVIAALSPGVLAPYTIDGRVYGLPYHTAPLGIWYNRSLFTEAGLDPDSPPGTWEEFLAAVESLQDASITPVALGGLERWPTLFWYGCLAARTAGADAFLTAGQERSLLGDPEFARAGELLREFAAVEPFQPGYETTGYAGPDGQASLVATGEAAMELMGSWAPGLYEAESGGLGEDLGWFPFPEVAGGRDAAAEFYGGGDGYVVGADAPQATIELLRSIFSDQNYDRIPQADASFLPVRADTPPATDDPNVARQMEVIRAAPTMQLYLDMELPESAATDLLESVHQMLTGDLAPEQALAQISEAWQGGQDY